MEKDEDIDLTLIITSSLLENEYVNTFNEISVLFSARTVPMGYYRGSISSMAETASILSEGYRTALAEGNYDCAMVIADRFELLPFGMVAAYMGLPLIHIQGFENSGNIDDKVRNALSALADLHLVSHYLARDKAKAQGVRNVHLTGCPSLDLVKEAVNTMTTVETGHIMGMFHPHTKEVEAAASQTAYLLRLVKAYCESFRKKLYWFGPNNDPGYSNIIKCLDIDFIHNMPGEDFYRLLAGADMIVGNSSCGIREASYLGIPAVNVGLRQENRVREKNVLDCDFGGVLEAMESAARMPTCSSTLFGDGASSQRILKIIKGEYCGKR